MDSADTYIKLKSETAELLNDVGQSLASLLDAPAAEGHADAHIDLTQQLGTYFGCYYKLRKRLERDCLSVAVLALTKSGKSTLINAFLGNEILPVNNVPETARICRIKHVPIVSCPEPVLELSASATAGTSRSSSLLSAGSAAFDASGLSSSPSLSSSDGGSGSARNSMDQAEPEVLTGATAIREHLQQLNRDVRAREHLRNDEKILNISAPLVVLDGAPGAPAPSSSAPCPPDLSCIQLCLLDTPGPNEAGEEGLKYQVERLLGRVDAAIYLLDYTKLKTAEEAGVLSRLKAINPTLVKRLCSRLFFAVNKMDQADESCGLDDEETRQYVAEIITQQLNCPDFKLHPDQVLLLSARDALLSRLILYDRSDAANTQRFCRVAFGAYNPRPRARNAAATSSTSLPGASGRGLDELRSAAAGLLEGSGVPELEERVLGYLCEAAAGVKLMATLDDTGRLLAEVSNVSSSCRAALAASTSALADKTAALQAELDGALSHFDRIMEGTAELQVEVTDELRAHLGNLRSRLFQYIYNALDADTLRLHQTAAAAAEDDTSTGPAGGEVPPGGAGDKGHSSGSSSRPRRGHGCCHSRHRRRCPGGNSSSGSSSSHHYFSACSEGGGSSGGGYAYGFGAGTAAAFAGADVFTGCMPGAHFAAGSGGGSGFASAAAGSSAPRSSGSSRSVPVVPRPPAAAAGGGRGGGGWWGLRQRFLNLFGRVGGGVTDSKDELSSALMDLSEDIMAQIQVEVSEAWHVMEGATNERATRLTASLNRHIQQLSAQLEGAVNEALQIQLEPVTLRMAAPDAVQFHADLTELIEKGIRHQQTRHVRTGERTDLVMEARRGACRLTQYYVQVPRRRRIIETYTATTYSLAPDAVLEHFMSVVDEAISTTEAQLPAYVKEYIRRQVEQARTRVQEYGNRYIDSLSAALEAASAGAEARQAALDQVTAYCNAFDALRARLSALQAKAELLVPHNTASGCGLFEQVDLDYDQGLQQQQEEVEGGQDRAAEGQEQEAGQLQQVVEEPVAAADVAAEVQQGGAAAVAVGVAASAAVAAAVAATAVAADSAVAGDEALEEAGPVTAVVTEPAAAAAVEGEQQQQQEPLLLVEEEEEDIPASLGAFDIEAAAAQEAAAAGADAAGTIAPLVLEDAVAAAGDVDAAAAAATPLATAAAGAASASSGSSSFFGALTAWMSPRDSALGGTSSSSTAARDTPDEQQQQQQQQQGEAASGFELQADDIEGAAVAAAEETSLQQQQQEEEGAAEGVTSGSNGTAAEVADAAAAAAAVTDVIDLTAVSEEGEEEQEAAAALDVDVPAAALGGSLLVESEGDESEGDVSAGLSDDSSDVMSRSSSQSSLPGLLDVAGSGVVGATVASAAAVLPLLSPVSAAAAAAAPAEGAPAPSITDGATAPAAAAAEPAAALSGVGGGDLSPSSVVSAAETAVSDSFSLMSGNATESSAFSGMTAGTTFTLQSSSCSGVSKLQEHLADSVLGELGGNTSLQSSMHAAAAAAAAGAPADVVAGGAAGSSANTEGDEGGQAPGSEFMYASMYGSGLVLSADDVEGALQMSALPAVEGAKADSEPAAAAAATAATGSSSSSQVLPVRAGAQPEGAAAALAVPAGVRTGGAATEDATTAGSSSSGAATVEGWQGDASLYASIIAHSEDHEQPGSPFDFGESFAAALSAAGLDTLSGPSPPSGSPRESGSDDWQIVDAAEGDGTAGQQDRQAAQAPPAQEGKASRGWMGGRSRG